MADRRYNLAIETSGREGMVALGRDDELIEVRDLVRRRRHDIGLMPTVAALCAEHDVEPDQVGEVYVSLGPGSFTGLRVGVATAKMLALASGVKLVGVPTLDVLAENAPRQVEHVAVCLNAKRGTAYCRVYRRDDSGFAPITDAGLRSIDDLLRLAPRPLAIIAEKLPEADLDLPEDVTVLPGPYARARAEVTWRLGRAAAGRGEFTSPATLLPMYVREPEAVTLWNQREAARSESPG